MKITDPKSFYSYFKDCYKLDYKEFVVDNLLSTKYKYKWFVKNKEELLNDKLPLIPYNNPKLNDLEKDIELFKLEKKLFYACFFILGVSENALVKDKRICAPLLLFPANIINKDDLSYLEIERESFIVNRAILSKLELIDKNKGYELFITELKEHVQNDRSDYVWLKMTLTKYFSNLDSEEMLLNPKVWSVSKIRSYYNTSYNSDEFKIVPAACTVLVDKSQSSLKVLNDLEQIVDTGCFNSNLMNLLEGEEKIKEENFSYFKSRLNNEQYLALLNSCIYENSVLVGPPGTGKSYTITSIVADAVVKGKSVLIVSKTKQAVEVIRGMLEVDFKLKDFLIHTTGNKYKMSLMNKIQKYLSGISAQTTSNYNEYIIESLYRSSVQRELEFKEYVDKELKLSALEFTDNPRLFDGIRKIFLKMSMDNDDRLLEIFKSIEVLSGKLDKELKIFCKRKIEKNIRINSSTFRNDISLYYDALDASNFTERKKIADNIDHERILKVFPIWLANLSDLNSVLPLQKDLFDLVIIDEATQCDIASALPAIYRAKKVIISGDPNQLRHYSFVSNAQQNNLLKKYNLPTDKVFDYRNRSILDFYISKVKHQEQITFLREHFRSTPSLIEFSNQHFYSGQLEVLKSTPNHTSSSQIELIELDGERNIKGINEKEANEVIKKINELVKKYDQDKEVPSVGVISLFSAQVNYLNKLIREKFTLKTIKKFDILCGTPYSFQGSEREIVLLSFALCDNTHHSAFIHANKPEVLNVAITRARSYQYIFKSVCDFKLDKESLIGKYFSFIKDYTHFNKEEVEKDDFQVEVVKKLEKKGYKNIKCGYPVGGCLLDIFIEHRSKHFFIDLIGYPGMFKEAFTLERYKTLGRMGIKSIPLTYTNWKSNKTKALTKVIRQMS